MSGRRLWVVLNDDGSVNCQPIIQGDLPPSKTGDNPGGLAQFRVNRHGDLTHEHFDGETTSWISDRGKKLKTQRRAMLNGLQPDDLADHLAAEVAAKMHDRFAALEARISQLEKKVA